MSLELLKQDKQALFCIACAVLVCVIWSIDPRILFPVELMLRRNPIIALSLFLVVGLYTYRQKQRSEYHLRKGWTVWGNSIE